MQVAESGRMLLAIDEGEDTESGQDKAAEKQAEIERGAEDGDRKDAAELMQEYLEGKHEAADPDEKHDNRPNCDDQNFHTAMPFNSNIPE